MTEGGHEASGLARFARFLRLSLSSHDHDFTSGSLRLAVALLAVPMVLEPLMESLFAVFDILFVGQLGEGAIAAVGLTEAVLILVFALGMGLGIPTTAIVARRIGEEDATRAGEVAVQANGLGLVLSLPLAVVASLHARELLALMGAEQEVIELGASYAAITFASSPIITLLFVNSAVFRGTGDAPVSLAGLWLANGINLVLDPCLIFGLGPFPELGLEGAAIATVIGRSVGLVYLLYRLVKGTQRFRVTLGQARLQAKLARELFVVSLGGMGQLLVETTSWLFLARIVAVSGSTALAGYTIATRVLMFFLMPAWGLSGAAATLVGQNLGANKPKRAEQSLYTSGWANTVFLGVVMLVCFLAAEGVAGLFTPDASVQPITAEGLRIVAVGFLFYGWGMVLVQAFNGAGDTRTPLVLNLVCFWLLKLPLAYGLSVLTTQLAGATGVYIAVTLAYSINAVLAWLWFRRGMWKQTTV